MKKWIFVTAIVCLLLLLSAGAASAQQHPTVSTGRFGIGAVFGEPTGVTAKWWLTREVAMDVTAAWSFANDSAFQLHVDYLIHQFGLLRVREGRLPVYLGIGGRVKFADDTKVGIRIPVGMSYLFAREPIEIFGELVPTLDLAPSTKAVLMGGVGIRYYFR